MLTLITNLDRLSVANSKKRCRCCKKYGKTEEMYKTPNNAYFCDTLCATEYAYANKEVGKKIKHKAQKKKVQTENTSHQHKLTQTAFNRMRVLQELKWFKDRGLEPTCISCNKPNMDWCCGHFKTRGAQGNLRYDEKNTYLQCNRYCNMALSGNINGNKTSRGYISGLSERFGDKQARLIIDYCETNTSPRKFTGEELKALRVEFNKQIRELEKELESD